MGGVVAATGAPVDIVRLRGGAADDDKDGDFLEHRLFCGLTGCRVDNRGFSLKCVSRCCFMLSARVNFLVQPSKEQGTAFSAVWILEWREAWPDVVKVLSQPCEPR
jgi:hypothetical protein